jgi:hypothetical protein
MPVSKRPRPKRMKVKQGLPAPAPLRPALYARDIQVCSAATVEAVMSVALALAFKRIFR